MRQAVFVALALLALACEAPAQGAGVIVPNDAARDLVTGDPGAPAATDPGDRTDQPEAVDPGPDRPDALADPGGQDPARGDGEPGADPGAADPGVTDTSARDAAGATDHGATPPLCGTVSFRFRPEVTALSWVVAGTFSAWSTDPADGAVPLTDPDGDGTFEGTGLLGPGTWLYKFAGSLPDGGQAWFPDPDNPDRVDDNFGGFNSRLVVPECPDPKDLTVQDLSVEPGGAVRATLRRDPGAGPLQASDLAIWLDFEPRPGAAVTVEGAVVTVALQGVPKGIHDLQVRPAGSEALDWTHLKVYVETETDWEGQLLYFAMTDRFANGDSSNDAPLPDVPFEANFQGGDFAGIRQKIEAGYFDALGVGALWISWPVKGPAGSEPGGAFQGRGCGQNPKTTPTKPVRFSDFHGYWPAAFREVEPRFGTLDELRALVKAAHARGIRVLLDYTANHVHTSSAFFQAHQDDGYFHMPAEICADIDWVRPVTCWFTSFLADLNTANPAVVAELVDTAEWWVKQVGADGFRVDAAKHVDVGLLQALRARMDREFAGTGVEFTMIGETFTGNPDDLLPFQGPDKLQGQFDFPFNYQVLSTLALGGGSLRDMHAAVLANRQKYGAARMSSFLGNHDMDRFISLAAGDIGCGTWDIISGQSVGWLNPPGPPARDLPYERLRLAMAYTLTQPGIPLLYYGDEFGMPGAGDPDNRRMMRFGAALNGREEAMLSWTRSLGAARKASPALRKGRLTAPLWEEGDVLVYGRKLLASEALIGLNRSGSPRTLTVSLSAVGLSDGTWTSAFGGSATASGGSLEISLPPVGVGIWTHE